MTVVLNKLPQIIWGYWGYQAALGIRGIQAPGSCWGYLGPRKLDNPGVQVPGSCWGYQGHQAAFVNPQIQAPGSC